MSVTLPNMSLTQWNLGADQFSFSQLAANFLAIDNHDHSSGKGVQVPAAGILNGAVTNSKLGADAVDSSKILNASVADADLASPNNGVYRLLLSPTNAFQGGQTAATYWLCQTFSPAAQGVAGGVALPILPWVAADYNVAGKTLKMNLKTVVTVNAVAPTVNLTLGLYPVASSGGAGPNISWAGGTVVSGSTILFTTPGASSITVASSGDFVPPADGNYALGFVNSATVAANSLVNISARLRLRAV